MTQHPLAAAFESTTYHGPQGPIRIGLHHPEADSLCASCGAGGWAIMTAFNPAGTVADPAANTAAQNRLRAEILEQGVRDSDVFDALNEPDAADAPVEPSLFIVGIDPIEALRLAARFHQLAIVYGFVGREAMLLWTADLPDVTVQPWDRSNLSLWAWGDPRRIGDEDVARNLGNLVRSVLQVPASESAVKTAVDWSEVTIRPSRLRVPAELAAIMTVDTLARCRHTYGRSWPDQFRAFHGDFSTAPDVVAFPANERDLARIFAFATATAAVVVPFGGGTNVVRCFEPDSGSPPVITVSMRRMRAVLDVDPRSLTATLGAGLTGPEVTNALQPFGLQLRHYPQSWEFSTVGGWVATRAGGHFATRYTHIDDLLVSVRTMAPAGVIDTLRVPRSGAGPEPMRSVLGAEGTTGIVTSATLRVFRAPRFRAGFDAFFGSWSQAVEACRILLQSGLTPSNCRLLDAREAMINQVDGSGRSILLVSFESDSADTQALADVAAAMIGGLADEVRPSRSGERQQAQSWKTAFLDAPYLQPRLLTAGITVDTFETSTSWSQLGELRKAAITAVSECAMAWGAPALVSTRLTHAYHDGACLYVTWITPTSGHPLEQWAAIKQAANEILRQHRASATHHHSVGREHLPVYLAQTPSGWLNAQRAFRRSVDPDGLLVPWLQSGTHGSDDGSER